MKKVPVYDQHLLREDPDPNVIKTSEDNYFDIFRICSSSFALYFINKIPITNEQLAQLLCQYFKSFSKIFKQKESYRDAVKAIWAVFEKLHID